MKNWFIRTHVRLRCWLLGLQYRRDHKRFRKGYAWVMCAHHIDGLGVGEIQEQINRCVREWDKKHPYGPPSGFNEGAVMALRKIREIGRQSAKQETAAGKQSTGAVKKKPSEGKSDKPHWLDKYTPEKKQVDWAAGLRKGADRNRPCACGSGKKFKRCCIDKPTQAERRIAL